jgi:hypothetical protein
MPAWLQIETHAGQTLDNRGWRLTPFAQSLRIRWPFLGGGLVWNRPVSVLAVAPDGQENVLPVNDVTRQIVWTLYALALLAALVAGLESLRLKRKARLQR